jgi:hypothetical protein
LQGVTERVPLRGDEIVLLESLGFVVDFSEGVVAHTGKKLSCEVVVVALRDYLLWREEQV